MRGYARLRASQQGVELEAEHPLQDKRSRHFRTRSALRIRAITGHLRLLDHLVGLREQCGRQFKHERLGGFEVDRQLEPGGLLDGKVRGFSALQDTVNVADGESDHLGLPGP